MNNYFYLATKNVFNTKTTIKKILLLGFSIFLLIFIFSFKSSMLTYINEGIKKNLDYKSLSVDQDFDTNTKKIIESFKKIKHVNDAFLDNYNLMVVYTNTFSHSGSFYLKSINKKDSPNLIKGNFFSDENEIICPQNFYPNDNLEGNIINYKYLIKMNNYINKDIDISYNIYNHDETFIKKDAKLLISGIYENNSSYIDENICYCSLNLIKKIYDESYKNINQENVLSSIIVRVDNTENIDYVKSEITNLGYTAFPIIQLKNSFINTIKILIYIVMIFIIILVVVIINFINKKNIDAKKKTFIIYKSCGFTRVQMIKILIMENLIIGCLSLLCTLTFIIFLFAILNVLVYHNPFIFSKFPIILNLKSVLFFIVIMLLVSVNDVGYLKKHILKDTL